MLLLPRVIAKLFLLAKLSACALLCSTQLAAQPKYSVVYRADPRPPAEVFQHGFSSQGKRVSLLDHVFGGSCDAEALESRSAWVGTTGNLDYARAFAFTSLGSRRTAPGSGGVARVWIYTIHTDETYFDTNAVFQQMAVAADHEEQGYIGILAVRMRALINSIAAQERQDVVTRRVAPENIMHARTFTGQFDGDGTGWNIAESYPWVFNTGFREPRSVMTSHVENLQELVPGHNLFYYTQQNESCSQACDGASASNDRRIRRSTLLGGLSCAASPSPAQTFIGSED